MNSSLRIAPPVWWVVWCSFVVGLVLTLLFHKSMVQLSLPEWARYAFLVLLMASLVIRWFVYPRSKNHQQRLVTIIVGCHLIELGALASREAPLSYLAYAVPVLALYCPLFMRPWQD